jgi:hypothetical protein
MPNSNRKNHNVGFCISRHFKSHKGPALGINFLQWVTQGDYRIQRTSTDNARNSYKPPLHKVRMKD